MGRFRASVIVCDFWAWCPAMLELDGRLRPIEDIEMELEARLVTRRSGCLMLLDLA